MCNLTFDVFDTNITFKEEKHLTWDEVVRLLKINITKVEEPDFILYSVYIPCFQRRLLHRVSKTEVSRMLGYDFDTYLKNQIIRLYDLETLLATKIKIK